MKARQIEDVRPRRGTLTDGRSGAVTELRFEQSPDCPIDFHALNAATGEPVVFHRGDQVHIDQLGPQQSVLIASRISKRPKP